MKQRTKWKYWSTFPRCKAFGKNQTCKKREKHLASRKTQYISKQQCIMHSSIKPCLHRTISVLYPALEGERLQHTCYRTLNIHLEPLFPKAIFRKTLCIVCLYLILYTDKHHKKKKGKPVVSFLFNYTWSEGPLKIIRKTIPAHPSTISHKLHTGARRLIHCFERRRTTIDFLKV